MPVTQAFLAEFENEAKTTRGVLERVPADKLAWKPHPKSMSLGSLAWHVATTPGVICGWPKAEVTEFGGRQEVHRAYTEDGVAAHAVCGGLARMVMRRL